MPADAFECCDRLEESIVAMLAAESALDDLQKLRLEEEDERDVNHIRVLCSSAEEYQNHSGIWIIRTEVKLCVHAMDDFSRDNLLTWWATLSKAMRRTDLCAALTTNDLKMHGSRAWKIERAREEHSWVRGIACELLASLRT